MRTVLLLLFSLTSFIGHGQNLVPNPSFEDTIACNIMLSGKSLPCPPWVTASGTSDYLSSAWGASCNSNYVFAPNNPWGFQFARTGIAFCGFATSSTPVDVREYIQCPLTATLIAGHSYYVSFYVSLGDKMHYAVDRIGACLTNTAISANNYDVLNYVPQIENSLNNVITDTTNWTLISGYFYASGGEKYLTIGNFRNDSNTVIDTLAWGTELYSYYYIDDVSVTDSVSVGFGEITNETKVKSYPNPFSTQLSFKTANNEQTTVYIFNFLGQQVLQQTFTNSTTLNTAQLADGLYFYELRNGKQVMASGKVVKQ